MIAAVIISPLNKTQCCLVNLTVFIIISKANLKINVPAVYTTSFCFWKIIRITLTQWITDMRKNSKILIPAGYFGRDFALAWNSHIMQMLILIPI
jgi:hypothetical protein